MAAAALDKAVPSGDELDLTPSGGTHPGIESVNMLNELKKELSDLQDNMQRGWNMVWVLKKELSDLREDMKRKDREIEELRKMITENDKDKKEAEEGGNSIDDEGGDAGEFESEPEVEPEWNPRKIMTEYDKDKKEAEETNSSIDDEKAFESESAEEGEGRGEWKKSGGNLGGI